MSSSQVIPITRTAETTSASDPAEESYRKALSKRARSDTSLSRDLDE